MADGHQDYSKSWRSSHAPTSLDGERCDVAELGASQTASTGIEPAALVQSIEMLQREVAEIKNRPRVEPSISGPQGETEPRSVVASDRPYVFGKAGQCWKVIFAGGPEFYILDTLGVAYIDYLLHHPNTPISAYNLETTIRPYKAMARPKDSIQDGSARRARSGYLRDLENLRADREDASESADLGRVDLLDRKIARVEDDLRRKGKLRDAGERARDNVRKAIGALRSKLAKGNQQERAFGVHIGQLLRTGYECLYSSPEGRIWG